MPGRPSGRGMFERLYIALGSKEVKVKYKRLKFGCGQAYDRSSD
jgi:hypothetical protein